MLATVTSAGIGAIFGAWIRYGLTNYGKKNWPTNFPWATLVINLSGALILGLIFALNLKFDFYTLIGTGAMGGYTTFSTLNVELLKEFKKHSKKIFLLYGCCSYLGGLLFVFLGFSIGKLI